MVVVGGTVVVVVEVVDEVVVELAWHTVIVTVEPLLTVVPPVGFWFSTEPFWVGLQAPVGWALTTRPWPTRVEVAAPASGRRRRTR